MSKSPRQKWKNSRERAVRNAQAAIGGDRALNVLTRADALKYRAWLMDRVVDEEIEINTANRELTSFSGMWTKVSNAKGLDLAPHFQRLAIEGGITKSRPPTPASSSGTASLRPARLTAWTRRPGTSC
jgi:hypothetical protein